MKNPADRKIVIWSYAGFLWMIIAGSLLHFIYEWSGNCVLAGCIGAVNESVWEHLKLGYWSLFFYTIIEYPFLKNKVKSYFAGKAAGTIVHNTLIVVMFYIYTSFTGKPMLWIDLTLFIIGAFLCQLIGRRLSVRTLNRKIEIAGLAVFILIGLLFVLFTFFTPHLPIFRELETGLYGIPQDIR